MCVIPRICCIVLGGIFFLLTDPCSLPEGPLGCTRSSFLKWLWRMLSHSFCSFQTPCKSMPHSHETFIAFKNCTKMGHTFKNSCCQQMVNAGMSPKMQWCVTFNVFHRFTTTGWKKYPFQQSSTCVFKKGIQYTRLNKAMVKELKKNDLILIFLIPKNPQHHEWYYFVASDYWLFQDPKKVGNNSKMIRLYHHSALI